MANFDKIKIDGSSYMVHDTETATALAAETQARKQADIELQSSISDVADDLSNFKFRNVYYPEEYGAAGNGVSNDYNAIQQCVNAASGNGVVVFTSGKTYLSNEIVVLPSNTYISGYGATLKFPVSHGFQNSGFGDPPTTTNVNIIIEGLNLDGGGTYDGLIRFSGVHKSIIRDCYVHNVPVSGVTTGISLVNGCNDILIVGCTIDVADYCIIIASETATRGQGVLFNENIRINSCNIITDWGSGIAMQGGGRFLTVSNCNIEVSGYSNNVGLGIKINEGESSSYNVSNVTVSGCTFNYGRTGSNDNAAITMGNYNDYISITGCTFNNFYNCITPNYTNGTVHIVISGCICTGGDNSLSFVNATTSATVHLALSGCEVYGVDQAIAGGSYDSTSITALVCRNCDRMLSISSSNMVQLSGCYAYGCSQTTVYISTPVSGSVTTLSGCGFFDCSPGNPVVVGGSGNLVLSGCSISNQTGAKPTYAVQGAGRACIVGCWLYGFQTGYFNLSDSSSITDNNVERGGIG